MTGSEDTSGQSASFAEAVALVDDAASGGLTLRLFGGVAIRLRATVLPSCLERTYNDIDLIAPKRSSRKVDRFFSERGYTSFAELNALHGHYRLWFREPESGRPVDVFVGKFEMCHIVPLGDRLDLDRPTVPPAELALTKLQIVELTEKDKLDLFSLFLNHEVGASDAGEINGPYIGRICADDWGLWRTCTRNLELLAEAVGRSGLSEGDRETVRRRLRALIGFVDDARKSLKWRTRSTIGERLQWYELPEEPDPN
jgi:hypothetical protein